MQRTTIKFFKGFVYAFQGIIAGFTERNMRFHGVAAVVAVLMGIFFQVSRTEWMIIAVLIGSVWAAELMNTAIEEVSNCLRDECGLPYGSTRRARDTAAGGVLVIAVVAAVIGLAIFVPKILELFFFSTE